MMMEKGGSHGAAGCYGAVAAALSGGVRGRGVVRGGGVRAHGEVLGVGDPI